MNYWFTSDLHFFHKNILKYSPDTRPSATLEDMHRDIINKWNSLVQDGDQVYLLGDVSFSGGKNTASVLEQLNGDIHLIYGNHDKIIRERRQLQKFFTSTQDYLFTKINGQAVAMMHFPIIEWENMHYGSFHLFGHAHQAYKTIGGKSMNVGIDTRDDYGLYSWDEVCEFMADKPVLRRAEFNNVRQIEK
jgi:calcineurin-like phosphoesterase family protein